MDNGVMKFPKGQVIFREGEMGSCLYGLLEGKVGVYAKYGTPGEKLLTELVAGNGTVTFGEMGLIDMMPRSATVVALEDVTVRQVSDQQFGDYFKDDPEAVLAIMRNMSKRIRALSQDYLDACRAVAEVVESDTTGKEKSSWFQRMVSKYVQDHHAAMEYAAQNDVYYHDYYKALNDIWLW